MGLSRQKDKKNQKFDVNSQLTIDKRWRIPIISAFNFIQEGFGRIMYAVIKTGGKQYRVSEGSILEIEKINGSQGDEISFDDVLMVSKSGDVKVGTPVVEGAKVTGEIITQTKGPKITVFKMKRRKGFRKKTGHRQQLTVLKIKGISM